MSATLAANVTVTGNLPAATNFYPADISSTGGFNLFQTTIAPNGLGPGAYAYHMVIVLNDGTVRVCGRNNTGQLGQNDLVTRSTVVSVLGISSQAIAVSCGNGYTAILLNDGTVRVCGDNTFAQLGQNNTATRSTVVSVLGISSQAIAVACGSQYISILLNDGTVRVCGRNNFGQLGLNDQSNRSTVVPVLGISSQAIAVACCGTHTAILLNDGTVRVCGFNNNGQLGQNDTVNRSTVVPVLGISSQAIAVACGGYHTAILMNDGTVRACGNNLYGQLGQNDTANRSTVVPVLGVSSQAIAVACGKYHTTILLNNGTVRTCGYNNNGQLGLNDLVTRLTFVPVLGISSQAIAVACGNFYTAILLNDGTVRVCGQNNTGQLGLNDLVQRSTVVPVLNVPVPTPPQFVTGPLFSASNVAQGSLQYHAAILMSDGTVRTCGYNAYGQLGQNDKANRSTIVPVLGISSQAIAVACGKFHTAILMNDGTVRVCGRNDSGQLGLNDLVTRSTVVSVLGISSQAIAIACGQYFTAMLLNDGTVRVCGKNTFGNLGQNDTVNRSTFVPVLGISSQAIAIACGAYTTLILMNDGTVRVCGYNGGANLGQNDTADRSTVVSVLGISSQAIAVAGGTYHTAILLNDGTVRVCGRNQFAQLGQNLDGTVTRSTVVSVLGISSQAIGISCGENFTCILMNDGTVRVCGKNTNGALGQNDLADRSTVVPVLGISSQAIAVAGGKYHTSILLNDGSVRRCGANNNGQLGLNDVITRSTVVPVLASNPFLCYTSGGNNAGVSTVGAGSYTYHTALVMNDGTVRVCGYNASGQLGQNDLVTRSTVVSVLGISSQAIAAACGANHTAIVMNDGTVRVCGRNNNGQLGQNDVVTRSTVVSILGISSQAIAVACSQYFTAILLNNGTVRVCGRNTNGQLGQNDLNTRSTVVPVLGISSQAIAVACGATHTAILMNDGTVRVTGRNNTGQLGQNDTNDRSTVVSVLGISSQAIAVACGQGHTVILLNDGTVRVTGRNNLGQLGQNDTVTRSTVVPVLGISSQAIAIACGLYHTSILLNDGTVRVCGRNTNGQLGQNDLNNRSTVVSVLGISSQAITVACGAYHTTILLNDGTVRTCGFNAFGQLGQNDLNNRSTVVSVPGIKTSPYLNMGALSLGLIAPGYQLDLSTDSARKLSTSTWFTGSDARIKTNIQTANLQRCSEIIDALDLKYFKWAIQSDDKHALGWIAQDVEKIFPKSVESDPVTGTKILNSDQLIKVMYGSLKNMIQKTYPPTAVGDGSSTQVSALPVSDPASAPNQ